MLQLETAGKSFSKAQFNQHLRDGPLRRRTKSSVEYRMQNISAVLQDFGANWLRGYRPADNVGKVARSNIARLLFKRGMISAPHTEPTSDPIKLDEFVAKIRSTQGRGILSKHPAGQKKPRKILGSVVSYVRDPEVKAWVLEEADGICEGCHLAAPFVDIDGIPFLEVHHVVPLAEEGPDTVENAVAVCPNCHRHLHYGADRLRMREALYMNVERLTKPNSIISSISDDSPESLIKHAKGLDDEANP
jgi:5-methylcytosine-specific restriction enzyme A